MKWKSSLAALLALCLIPVGAAAQATGSIRGTVTNAATGAPLAGASVSIPTAKIGGSPNSGVSITLRGTRSLTASNNPLVIVDGNQFGNLADLNASDIESIQVLKDASSTAIYASRFSATYSGPALMRG